MRFKNMKILRILTGIALLFPIGFVLCAASDSAPSKNSHSIPPVKHGKNGKSGTNSKNGTNGADSYSGCGGNGGNGANNWYGPGGNGGNGGNSFANPGPEESSEQFKLEYKKLKETSLKIIDNTIAQVYGSLPPSGNQDALKAACKKNVSAYLLQTGTPPAQKLLREYENLEWTYPDIRE